VVLAAGKELELPVLCRLEAAGRRQVGPELEEVLGGHRLQDVHLGDEQPLDRVHPAEKVTRPPGLAAHQRVADGLELVQQLLEPQLIDLVHGDEQQLVVGRRAGLRYLLGQQLVQPQVAAVGELPALFAETAPGGRNVGHRNGPPPPW
jgi:hypothetical protein